MTDSHTDGKPDPKMIERQRTMMRDMRAAMVLLGKAIADAEAEGASLAQQSATFAQAEQRGETPVPREVARVVAAEDALVQRLETLGAHMRIMGEQAEAITHTADSISFEYLRRQFNAQFNTKEGL